MKARVSQSKVKKLIANLLIVFLSQCWSTTLAMSDLDNGINEYNSGRYIKALLSFDLAVSSNKKSALAHYYRANTLVYLGQRDEAAEEYKLAYALCPAHSQMARYCLAMLLPGGETQSPEECKKKLMQQFVTHIDAELSLNKECILRAAQANANYQSKLADIIVKKIQAAAEEEIQGLMNNPMPIFIGRRIQFIPRTEEMNSVREKAEKDVKRARNDAKKITQSVMADVEKRQMELEKSATNLERQFLFPGDHGVKLSVLGTNLYVRNYVIDESPNTNHEIFPLQLVAKERCLKSVPINNTGKRAIAHRHQNESTNNSGLKQQQINPDAQTKTISPEVSITSSETTDASVRGKIIK